MGMLTKRAVDQRKDEVVVPDPVVFLCVYLGGLPGDVKVVPVKLHITSTGIWTGKDKKRSRVFEWSEIAGVSFDSNTTSKSRAGKAMVVGVFALAAKNTQSQADLTFVMKDGNAAIFQMKGWTGPRLRAKVQPFLAAAGVPCLDDGLSVASAVSVADELGKLAALRDAGVLTDDEFADHKAKLLS